MCGSLIQSFLCQAIPTNTASQCSCFHRLCLDKFQRLPRSGSSKQNTLCWPGIYSMTRSEILTINTLKLNLSNQKYRAGMMLLKSSWWDMKLRVGWTSVAYKVTDWPNVPLPVLWCQNVLAIPCPVSPILSRLSLSLCVLPPWLSWLLIHADYDHLPPIRLINLKSLLRFFIHFMLDCCFSYCCSFRPSLWYSVSVLIVLCILVSFVFFLSLSHVPRD